jgi:hypothetical protein
MHGRIIVCSYEQAVHFWVFKVDAVLLNLANKAGHVVARLLPYHCNLNPGGVEPGKGLHCETQQNIQTS